MQQQSMRHVKFENTKCGPTAGCKKNGEHLLETSLTADMASFNMAEVLAYLDSCDD
jgi:hypothetical protein